MTYNFGRSTFCSPRGRDSSFYSHGRGASPDSYHSSSHESSTEQTYRGSSFQNFGYRSRDNYRDSNGRGTHRYSGERDPRPFSFTRRDEGSSFHRRETRESSAGSYGREHFHSRRSDSESDRKQARVNLADSFEKGYCSRRSYDEHDHPNRSLSSFSSSPYRSDSNLFGGESFEKDFDDFKKPQPPSDSPRYRGTRPRRGIRGRTRTTIRPTSMPSLSWRNPTSRFKRPSRLQLTLRKKKQMQISRMRKKREARDRPCSSGEPSYAEDNVETSSTKEEPNDYVKKDVDMKEGTSMDDWPPGVSLPPSRRTPVNRRSSAEKSRSHSYSPKFEDRTHSRFGGTRRIALKCPHCKRECKMFRTYQTHLSTYRHKAAMEQVLYRLKQKLKRLRTEQRMEQRVIDERNDFNRTYFCKLCKLTYKQSKKEHLTSDFHINISEFLNSKCKICHMGFATPMLYEHHRCTLTHIKRKAFLERKGAFKDEDTEKENYDDGNFMVLDSVGSADESNENVDSLEENMDASKKTSPGPKKKTTIIGNDYIKKVGIYYCELCKLCLHYIPNRDAEDGLLSHCRSRFHLKQFSLKDANKNSESRISDGVNKSAREKSTVVAMDGNEEGNNRFQVDVKTTDDDPKLSGDEDDSNSGNRYDRFSPSDRNESTDKVKVDSAEENQPANSSDEQQNVVMKNEPK